jgi:hypothetical protein
MMNAPFHMPAELVIELPMPPSSNNMFATDKKSGRRFRTAEYSGWLLEAGYRLNAQRPPLMAGKVAILIEVEEPRPLGARTFAIARRRSLICWFRTASFRATTSGMSAN